MKPKSWMITVVAILIIFMMVWPKVAPKNRTNPISTVPITKEEDKPRYNSEIFNRLATVGNIWWETEEETEPEATGQAVGLTWDYVDMVPLRNLVAEQGLIYNKEKSQEFKTEYWENSQKNSTLTYSPQTRKLEWITTIEKMEDLGSGNLPSQEEAEEIIRSLVRNLSSTKTVTEIEIKEISPKRLVYPRWVTTEAENAQVWQIAMNYTVMGKNVIRGEGSTIEAVVGRGGKIISLKMVWPMSVDTNKTVQLSLKTIEEVKSGTNQIRVWSIKGGEKTDLSYETDLSKVGVNGVSLVYWWEPGEKWLMPYYLLTGNGIAAGEPVGVEMVIPAGKL
ncbi:MAG: hypothetical protein WCT01_04500 [Candidatus Shapirobacteria bacterium]